jgi:HSP20 family protein
MLNTLFANDVRQTLDQFRRSVDQMFENFYSPMQQNASNASGDRNWTFSPVLESGWNDNFYHLRAILPGVSEKDVNVSVQNNQLVIEGERKVPEGFEKNAITQLAYGKFYTTLALPPSLNVDQVKCHMSNGILDIQLPISEASKPKQIPIHAGEGQRAISA